MHDWDRGSTGVMDHGRPGQPMAWRERYPRHGNGRGQRRGMSGPVSHEHRGGSGIPSRANIFGHPIHPTLIPYPLTYLTSVLATDIAYRRTRDPFWARASGLLLKAGLATGVVAGAVGAVDYAGVKRVRRHPEGHLHAFGNVAALALSAWSLKRRNGSHEVQPRDTALSATVALLLGVTALAGAELIYRHKVAPIGREDPDED